MPAFLELVTQLICYRPETLDRFLRKGVVLAVIRKRRGYVVIVTKR